MSTRAQIVVEIDNGSQNQTGEPVLYPHYIYKHCDGYPEGITPVLRPLFKHFLKERGYQADYLIAQIIRRYALTGAADYRKRDSMRKESGGSLPPFMLGGWEQNHFQDMLSWGVDGDFHGDIEYLYVLRRNGDLEIRETNDQWWDDAILENAPIIKTYKCGPRKKAA